LANDSLTMMVQLLSDISQTANSHPRRLIETESTE
jgi:hypothetical protein